MIRTSRDAVLALIAVSALIRLILAASTGLGVDESYMVGNARVFALATVDHPPLHTWIAGAMMWLTGSEAPIVVRLPFVLLFAGSTWLMFGLARRFYGETAGFFAALLFNSAPVFGIAHGAAVLPDGPLLFLLLASANVVAGIVFEERSRRGLLRWLAAGVLAGLALLSKYSAALYLAGVFLFLVSTPRARRHLATPGPWLGAVAALVVLSPALLWNAEHDMIGFTFQASRVGTPSSPLTSLGQNLLGQLLYLTPWVAVPLVVAFARALRAGRSDERSWFLFLLALGPVALFTLIALQARALPHWVMPGWLFIFPLAGDGFGRLVRTNPHLVRTYSVAIGALSVLVAAAIGVQATGYGFGPKTVAAAGAIDPTTDLVDWRQDLTQAIAAQGYSGYPAAAAHWIVAGKASYALGPGVDFLCLCGEPHNFPFRLDQKSLAGKDIILIWPHDSVPDWNPPLAQSFAAVERLAPAGITRRGNTLFFLDLAVGRNFRPPSR